MRMNGSCAGGTGAFLDEMAAVLKVPVERFDALAAKGSTVYDISGRCGVYAKTDIQPLLNQGAAREDLALSALHAVAKQTIGGLAQGLSIEAPVVFEGGPLTFNPTLVRVFAERLGLADGEALLPDRPETIVARGAALALSGMFADKDATLDAREAARLLEGFRDEETSGPAPAPLFATEEERAAFRTRHARPAPPNLDRAAARAREQGGTLRCYLGIDSGSTTTKLALVDEEESLPTASTRATTDGPSTWRATRCWPCATPSAPAAWSWTWPPAAPPATGSGCSSEPSTPTTTRWRRSPTPARPRAAFPTPRSSST